MPEANSDVLREYPRYAFDMIGEYNPEYFYRARVEYLAKGRFSYPPTYDNAAKHFFYTLTSARVEIMERSVNI